MSLVYILMENDHEFSKSTTYLPAIELILAGVEGQMQANMS